MSNGFTRKRMDLIVKAICDIDSSVGSKLLEQIAAIDNLEADFRQHAATIHHDERELFRTRIEQRKIRDAQESKERVERIAKRNAEMDKRRETRAVESATRAAELAKRIEARKAEIEARKLIAAFCINEYQAERSREAPDDSDDASDTSNDSDADDNVINMKTPHNTPTADVDPPVAHGRVHLY